MQTLWSDDRLPAKDVCQVPKTQEWGQPWGGLNGDGERAPRHSHTYTRTCIQNAEPTSRCAPQLQTCHHRITWHSFLSEALCNTFSWCIGPVQFGSVCYFHDYAYSLDANSPDLSHIHLAVCKQSMIGYSLISRYWIFLRTNTLLLTKGQKHQKGLHDSVCILAKRLYLLRWLNKTLTWLILLAHFVFLDR